MNKAVAEAIAGVIPHKMTRNRWRGILRFGLWNAIKLRHQAKRNTTPPKYYLSICAIAKNEGPYFKEWIEWHHKLGVEKFYIYDNESTDSTKEVLSPYIESGLVEYHFFPGKKQQLAAYDHCFNHYRYDTRWLAILDLDEYIVPVRDKSIPEFLAPLEEFSSVEINWLIYGSGGAKHKQEGKIMDRFRKHSRYEHKLNSFVKSIVDPRRVCSMVGCHEAARLSGKAGDSHGNTIKICHKDRAPQHDIIRINHYAVKSYEEFLAKRSRGRARVDTIRNFDYFEKYDLNDIED